MKKWIGVLGYPLTHSLSKATHEEFIRRASLDIEFRVMECPPDEFRGFIKSLKSDASCLGFSVTMPYKEEIIPWIDDLDIVVQQTRVVNCVKHQDGKWIGYNTDAPGFWAGFKHGSPRPPKDVTCVFLGAGATARSLGYVLIKNGYHRFVIVNRSKERAGDFAQFLKEQQANVQVSLEEWGGDIPHDRIFILNTTPVGMRSEKMTGIDFGRIQKPVWLFDVTYHPKETPFIAEGRKNCFYTMNGWPMFLNQAQLAFTIWTEDMSS